MDSPVLVSIQVGQPRTYGQADATDPFDKPWTTAFYKTPVTGPRWLSRTHLEGDGQANRKYHGGPDKAILAYSADHYPLWQAELPELGMSYGGLGENFSIAGLTEASVCIGDIYQIGEAKVQVSEPRQPCINISRRWHKPDLMQIVKDNGRSGWYMRVLQEGPVEAGSPVKLLERPYPNLSIALINHVRYHDRKNLEVAQALANCSVLSHGWRSHMRLLAWKLNQKLLAQKG